MSRELIRKLSRFRQKRSKNGPETISGIRANPEFRGLKIFAVTGSGQDDLDVDVGPQGVDRWFTQGAGCQTTC